MTRLLERLRYFTGAPSPTQIELHRSRRADTPARDRERGDVPGWVLVTIMTAGLVTALWAVAGDRLTQMFVQAMNAVSGPGG